MPRFKMIVEYDGAPYVGWQRQENGLSVQEALETAIGALTGEMPRIQAAGRTDSGVHAMGQVVHADLKRDWEAQKLRSALNAHLALAGQAVSVIEAASVDDHFDARFSALRRHYLYRIINRPSRPVLKTGRAWWVPRPLDRQTMYEAAQCLVGRHDFTTFRSAHCQAQSPLKTLDRLDVGGHGDMIEIRASAQSFLHNQIRSFVGTLKLTGEGKMTLAEVRAALNARDRSRCGPVAPPEGLYLMRVDYPEGA